MCMNVNVLAETISDTFTFQTYEQRLAGMRCTSGNAQRVTRSWRIIRKVGRGILDRIARGWMARGEAGEVGRVGPFFWGCRS